VGHVLDQETPRISLSDVSAAADVVATLRHSVVTDTAAGGPELHLLPSPPPEWHGANVSAHDLPTRFGRLSLAVRWHGPRPALLWELDGRDDGAVTLRAPTLDPEWSTAQRRGEALLGVSAT
jgi:hypothetical protein